MLTQGEVRARTNGTGCPICANKKVIPSTSLKMLRPDIAAQWHPSKNRSLTPLEVSPGSHKIVWWKCENGDDHEWKASVKDRTAGRGCPVCVGKRVVPSNSLSTRNPGLADEWHPTKNGTLTPDDVVTGSNKSVWWKCPNGDDHQWQAKIADRHRGDGCPVCANRIVVSSNSLFTLYPDLAQEWHPTKNGTLTPKDLTPGSNRKVWWKCPHGDDHEWKTAVCKRVEGTGCPVCSGKLVKKSNCLATISPEIAREWHPTKNRDLTPFDVTAYSNKKVWWKCPVGDDHEWKASVNQRSTGHGCAVCANLVIVHSNCLSTIRPDIAAQWHSTKNRNLSPTDVGVGSHRKVWWKCPQGDDHEWQASIIARVNGTGCPICSNRKVVESNSLAVRNPELALQWHPTLNGDLTPYDVTPTTTRKVWWKCSVGDDHQWQANVLTRNNGNGCPICSNRTIVPSNSLATLDPDLAAEWHPTKNGQLTPDDIGSGSGKKVWWLCKKGHEWKTSVDHRTRRGSGCPYCRNASSIPELRILAELATIFPSVQHRSKVDGNEIDIYIPEHKVGIEYDGVYWHKKKQKQDKEKNTALKDICILIRIREKGLSKISSIDLISDSDEIQKQTINELLSVIRNQIPDLPIAVSHAIDTYTASSSWIAQQHFAKLFAARDHINPEESLGALYAKLATQWHPTKNGTLRPEYFSPGSNMRVWWKCERGDDHEWQSTIVNRTQGQGCPICSNKKVVRSNSLAYLNPELAEQWHPTKNGKLKPSDVTSESARKVWWKCLHGDDHVWKATVYSRSHGTGCPICSNKKVIPSTSLAVLRPDLAREWHPTKNLPLTPFDVTPGSHTKVWWKCPQADDHVWFAQVKSRSKGSGCAMCSYKIIVHSNCLSTVYPQLAKEWHPRKNGDLCPDNISAVSTKKVWWKGPCGHEWQATVGHRAKRGQGCPQCWKVQFKTINKRKDPD
jgi:hypothetical protein